MAERWKVEIGGETVAAAIRAKTGAPWTQVKRWIERGKAFIDGERASGAEQRVAAGQEVTLDQAAPRPFDPEREAVLVYDDPHVVVIDKPAGVSSVPYEERERGTAMDLIRGAWKRRGAAATATPLLVVHRIDRATSGLLMFAKSKLAERALGGQLRAHTVERTYLCVAHGRLAAQRIESSLVVDRGDGLRGSTRFPGQGKRAVTHVATREDLGVATLCEVRLETGRTHQIRIHLSELGHPLLGETVYIRDLLRAGATALPAPRLMLHAATLGFAHPVSGDMLRFDAAPPPDFVSVLDGLRRRSAQRLRR